MRNKNSGTKIFVGLLALAAAVLAYFKFFKKKSPQKKKAEVYVGNAEILHSPTDEQLDLNGIEVPPSAYIKMPPIGPETIKYITDLKGYNSASPEYGGPRTVPTREGPVTIDYDILLNNPSPFFISAN